MEDALREIGLVPVYLSPYSPVFNPCELVFGHIKRNLRYAFFDEDDDFVNDDFVDAFFFPVRNANRHVETSEQLKDNVLRASVDAAVHLESFYHHCGAR